LQTFEYVESLNNGSFPYAFRVYVWTATEKSSIASSNHAQKNIFLFLISFSRVRCSTFCFYLPTLCCHKRCYDGSFSPEFCIKLRLKWPLCQGQNQFLWEESGRVSKGISNGWFGECREATCIPIGWRLLKEQALLFFNSKFGIRHSLMTPFSILL
jgi:hypothetical protein